MSEQPMPTLIRSDARNLPLPDESVDLIVTSPPYFGLRSYTDGGQHYAGQVGAEDTPREFIDALIACTREWMRVLKPSGSIFLNLGDKYAGSPSGPQGKSGARADRQQAATYAEARGRQRGNRQPVPNKSLMLLPERYRIAAVDELGLIARAVLVWSKPNGLPESVTDRVRRSHEDWVHLTKAPRYFAAVDEIREPHSPASLARYASSTDPIAGSRKRYADVGVSGGGAALKGANALGKLPGSVWEIATQPLKVPAELGIDHFAAFPMEWPRRLIKGWCPREVCTVCGEGRRPVVERTGRVVSSRGDDLLGGSHDNQYDQSRQDNGRQVRAAKGPSFPKFESTITGYACACPDTSAPSMPGVVLDPFSGTGTTALVATMLGRTGIGIDLSADYCRLAEWRASDPKERARAAGLDPDAVAKVHHQLPGQESLLDLLGEAS